jgi:uncharacterized membrane protein required for colicin V production
MALINIILLVALLAFVGAGWNDGFVHTLGRFVGAIFGFILARAWSAGFGMFLAVFIPQSWARLIAFILIFFVVDRLVGYLFKLAEGLFKIISFFPFLKSINNMLGACLGLVEGILSIGGVIWIILTLNLFPALAIQLKASIVAKAIEGIFTMAVHFNI